MNQVSKTLVLNCYNCTSHDNSIRNSKHRFELGCNACLKWSITHRYLAHRIMPLAVGKLKCTSAAQVELSGKVGPFGGKTKSLLEVFRTQVFTDTFLIQTTELPC